MKNRILSSKDFRREHLPDEDIIGLYWARDEKAIDETDVKYGGYLYTIAYNVLHDSMDCEECQNDTYLRVWNDIPPTRPQIFRAYLTKIIRRIAIDRYKLLSSKKRVPSELTVSLDEFRDTLADSTSVEQAYDVAAMGELIGTYLRRQTEQRQTIFVCRYYYADPVATIAEMCKLSERMIYMELSAMKRELREYLNGEGYSI